jgi:hypothetical protein
MHNKGVKDSNENLKNAALVLSDYFFGDLAVAEGTKTFVQKEDPIKAAESKAAEKYDNERYIIFRAGVSNGIRDQVSNLISEGDKLNSLSPFIRSVIIDKVIDQVGATLAKDQSHLRYMDSLWDRAKKNGRTDEDKTKLISAFLSRAKSLIPSIRSKLIAEATGSGPEASAEKLNKVTKVAARVPESGGRPSTKRTDYNPKRIDYRKTSDEDIINDEITYK